ncbi:MAG TPA: type II toxin-antitoxin system VapC family toxin [Solirubrobacteraceae bacterium]|jgi:PIN domain nuclease of toxin-antitoxin system|nr:type II toxin-antitoxin system VapC family toxin [Solirubrobacteraceae bacterium]
MKEEDADNPPDHLGDVSEDQPSRGTTRSAQGTKATLDASALAALLFDEAGAETVADRIADGAAISTVNISEVAKVLIDRHLDPDTLLAPVCDQLTVEPFTLADALSAATLYPQTARAGLSLGDQACLALAQRLEAPAVTAEHAWSEVDVGVEVEIIRRRRQRDQ